MVSIYGHGGPGFDGLRGLRPEIHVSHLLPGTSQWAIEHELFSAIRINWRGRPSRRKLARALNVPLFNLFQDTHGTGIAIVPKERRLTVSTSARGVANERISPLRSPPGRRIRSDGNEFGSANSAIPAWIVGADRPNARDTMNGEKGVIKALGAYPEGAISESTQASKDNFQ